MKYSVTIKNKSNKAEEWLISRSRKNYQDVLDFHGKRGIEMLAAQTPKDTGETANSWRYRIIQNGGNSWEVVFYNVAHPELESNLAFLIEYGHGTRTGGYVPPRPFIKQISKQINKDISNDINKEINK